ncbi:unnamed protein product [Ilex paraguariensis]|uniref:NAC domain-containing protein n=1 Tax=Ilex paraguariensis TaxID=185542 RepID=A0ABC8R9K6_9AQUA
MTPMFDLLHLIIIEKTENNSSFVGRKRSSANQFKEKMNLSVNGQSQVPPGFRFYPTEEELLCYYLKKKVSHEMIDFNVIREVGLNKLEPWDIQEKCKIGGTPHNECYFFCHKDRKYPTGSRTNRATAAGFWKATGRDKTIYSCYRKIGMRKTLVFYEGRAPYGQKSDWIIYEYRLDDTKASNLVRTSTPEDPWVVCRIFRKRNFHKNLQSPQSTSSSPDSMAEAYTSDKNGVLTQTFSSKGKSYKQEKREIDDRNINNNKILHYLDQIDREFSEEFPNMFFHLPRPEIQTASISLHGNISSFNQDYCFEDCDLQYDEMISKTEPTCTNPGSACIAQSSGTPEEGSHGWAAMDQLVVASQLNVQTEMLEQLSGYGHSTEDFCLSPQDDVLSSEICSSRPNQVAQVYNGEVDFWSFT